MYFARSGENLLLAGYNCLLVWLGWLVRRVLSSTSDAKDDVNLTWFVSWKVQRLTWALLNAARELQLYLRIVKVDSPLQEPGHK